MLSCRGGSWHPNLPPPKSPPSLQLESDWQRVSPVGSLFQGIHYPNLHQERRVLAYLFHMCMYVLSAFAHGCASTCVERPEEVPGVLTLGVLL